MKEQVLEGLRRPLFLFGVLLVGVGGFLLLYLGIMVFQAIHNPEKVKIVEFVLRHIQIDDKAIFGSLNHKPFEIYFSKSFKAVLFVISGIFMFWALAGIVKALISAGVKIIQLARVTARTGDDDRQSNSLCKPAP